MALRKINTTNPQKPGASVTSLPSCDKCNRAFEPGEKVKVKAEAPFACCKACHDSSSTTQDPAWGDWLDATYKP